LFFYFLTFKPNCILCLMVALPWSWFFYSEHQHPCCFLVFLIFTLCSLLFFYLFPTTLTLDSVCSFLLFYFLHAFSRLSPFVLRHDVTRVRDKTRKQEKGRYPNAGKTQINSSIPNHVLARHFNGVPCRMNPLSSDTEIGF